MMGNPPKRPAPEPAAQPPSLAGIIRKLENT